MKKNNTFTLSLCFSLMFSMLFMISCRPDPGDDIIVGESKHEFGVDDQIIIGTAISEIIKDPAYDFHLLDKADYQEVYEHVNTLMDQVTNTVMVDRREKFDWQVSILNNDEEANAFMVPGGHLYINTGLLKFLKGEHELIGVIAHEIAYADSDILINRMRDDFGSKALSKILSNDPDREDILLQIATDLKDLAVTQEQIDEADTYAVEIICEFLWDSHGLVSVLERGSEDTRPINWLQSKPTDTRRMYRLKDLIKNQGSCGVTDSTYEERYEAKILKRLP